MADKTRELEDRIDKLEGRLKATFLEVERRFETFRAEEPVIVNVEERIQEVEDLLLLLQLEITKMKDKVGGSGDFITVKPETDVDERLKKLEQFATGDVDNVSVPVASHLKAGHEKTAHADAKLQVLERKIAELESAVEHRSEMGSGDITEALDEIEKRLKRLESSRPQVMHAAVLNDVRHILES